LETPIPILIAGEDTAGRFCLIDMHIPPGGPPPHRHDFKETFVILEGELDATFRGKKQVVRAGETINTPANAPHRFHNWSREVLSGSRVPVADRTTAPPKLDEAGQAAFIAKVKGLAGKYRTELLAHA
jgi:quercetin dioxygenase-like cupin family protein